MKEIIAKSKPNTRNLPGRIVIGEKEIFDKKTIAKQFNDYFINIGLTFASNFQTWKGICEFFYELFSSLKSSKWRGYDYILSNVFKVGSNKVFWTIKYQ